MLPSFFCSAPEAACLTEELWAFARSAYLDNPLPSLLKERLFVHLSRFCEVRYCIVRHVGFLIGRGRPAGDVAARPHTIEQALRLLRRPVPDAVSLDRTFKQLEACVEPRSLPEPETEDEERLFDALTVIFLAPMRSARARAAVRKFVGARHFELLTAFLAFVRTAHYWTETHPELDYEPDMVDCMARHPELGALLLDPGQAANLSGTTRAAAERASTEQALRKREADLSRAQRVGRVGGLNIDVAGGLRGWRSPEYLRLHGLPQDTGEEAHEDWLARVHPEDREHADQALLSALRSDAQVYESEYRIVRHSDGAVRWIHARADIERSQDGAPLRLVGAHVDVTDQKDMQDTLRKSESSLRLNEIWLAAQREAFRRAMDGEALDVSLGTLIRGVSEQTDNDRRCAFRITDEHGHNLTHVGGMAESYEKHADGGHWSFPVETASGKLVGSLAMYFREPREPTPHDHEMAAALTQSAAIIISHHQASIALRESEERYRDLFASIDQGFCTVEIIFDAAGEAVDYRFLLANPAYERLTGLTNVVGRTLRELMPSHPIDWPALYSEVALTGTPRRFERFADELQRYYEIRAWRTGEPSQRRVGILVNDVSVRRRAEAALNISEQRFRQFAAASSGALWVRDARTLSMEYVSPAIEKIYGVEPGAILGDLKNWASLIVPDDRNVALEHIERARHGEAVVHEFRIQRTNDRNFRWIRNTDFPLLDELGQVQRIGGIAEDVTDAKLAVDHQKVLLAELQHRVRNIMAIIRSIANRTGERAESVPEYSALMAGRLLALARVQTLLTRAANASVGVATIVRDEVNAQAQHENQYVLEGPEIELSPKAAEVLTLAIHELSTNALKYGALSVPEGMITVRWEALDRRGTPWLLFEWVERGAPERLQSPSAPLRRGFGSELIEGRIPYELGGRGKLTIEPSGASCRLEFPLKTGASVLETGAPQAKVFGGALDMTGEPELHGHRVLVVEDEYYLASDIARALRGAGAEVIGPCPTEQAARVEIGTLRPDAALVDINLGDGPSFQLAETLQDAGIPFAFVTGYDKDVIPQQFGTVARLEKPVQLRHIVRALSKLLTPPT